MRKERRNCQWGTTKRAQKNAGKRGEAVSRSQEKGAKRGGEVLGEKIRLDTRYG